MADTEQEHPFGVVDKRRSQTSPNLPLTSGGGNAPNYSSVGTIRTRLAVANATYYTAARMNSMTKNDLVYALRVLDDAAGI